MKIEELAQIGRKPPGMQMSSELTHSHAGAASLWMALDVRQPATFQHCARVAGLCLELGRASGLSERELRLLLLAAAFHDVGKIEIPEDVLNKTTPFTAADWAIMKQHSANSQRIVLDAGLEDGEAIGLIVRHHHERYDGNGYPNGLAGDEIPLLARMIAIADAYDAMVSLRGYGPVRGHTEAMEELKRERGAQHDPSLHDRFVEVIERSAYKAATTVRSAPGLRACAPDFLPAGRRAPLGGSRTLCGELQQ